MKIGKRIGLIVHALFGVILAGAWGGLIVLLIMFFAAPVPSPVSFRTALPLLNARNVQEFEKILYLPAASLREFRRAAVQEKIEIPYVVFYRLSDRGELEIMYVTLGKLQQEGGVYSFKERFYHRFPFPFVGTKATQTESDAFTIFPSREWVIVITLIMVSPVLALLGVEWSTMYPHQKTGE